MTDRMHRRLLYVVSEDYAFCSHRIELARRARDAGWEVHVACRVSRHGGIIRSEGFALHHLELARAGRNPLADVGAIRALRRVVDQVDPTVVHDVAMKPVLYGTLVGRWCRVPVVVNTMAGMGVIFRGGESPKAGKGTRWVVQGALRSLMKSRRVWLVVQNRDDYALARAMLIDEDRLRLVAGSGLDLEQYPYAPRVRGDEVVITHVSRMLWDKGVGEAVEATRELRGRGEPVRLQVVGAPDPENPRSIPLDTLQSWDQEEGIDWLGHREDVAEILRSSDIAVLASYYGEGLPRSLLEAAATGLPIVACDAPGSRDLIEDQVNGLLVPPRDAQALAGALQSLVADPTTAADFGLSARARVVERYCDDVVLQQVLDLYDTAVGVRSTQKAR